MVFRPALSFLDACYAFSREHQASRGRLWPAVVRELESISVLLPLFRAELSRPWFPRVVASDASPYGLGVCHRSLDLGVVSNIGRTTETWRYHDAVSSAARRHALGEQAKDATIRGHHAAPELTGDAGQLTMTEDDDAASDTSEDATVPWAVAHSFAEVPQDIMWDENWLVVHCRALEKAENILRSEARAWLWALKHRLRGRRSIGHRVLTLVDNTPLACGVAKGRARSAHLRPSLRIAAAVCRWCRPTGTSPTARPVPSLIEIVHRG